jgi:GDPmannose 4,6-dehydratase
MTKTALITGITGQDGSYLAELLLDKGYRVVGMTRRSSTVGDERIAHLAGRLELVQGDLLDQASIVSALRDVEPQEVYNLAAQSFVPTSWNQPVLTGEFTGLGVTRMLEAIRQVDLGIRFYQASSSEMFGKVREVPQTELTPFHPRSPYGVAKAYGHFLTVNYRESYGLFACSGISFNHESPRRGLEFVTRKIANGAARVSLDLADALALGNLDAERDWGHARDYVEMQWLMLQQPEPEDYVIATGEQHSVREFVEHAARELGIAIEWRGEGAAEEGLVAAAPEGSGVRVGQRIVAIDPRYYRLAEVETLLGDPTKAREKLGWTPRTSFADLVREMVASDLDLARRDALVVDHGYRAHPPQE